MTIGIIYPEWVQSTTIDTMTGLFRRGRESKTPKLQPTTEEIMDEMLEHLPSGPIEWGIPTRCPMCDAWGYIDRLDLVDRAMLLHCPSCMFRWEITEEQIDAVKEREAAESANS